MLILTPQDGAAAAAAVDEARAAGVKVIANDRLILDTAVRRLLRDVRQRWGGRGPGPVVDRPGRDHEGQQPLPVRRCRLRQQLLPVPRGRLGAAPAQDRRRHVRDQELEHGRRRSRANPTLTRDQEAAIIGQVTTNWDYGIARSLAEANLLADPGRSRAPSSSWPRTTPPLAPSRKPFAARPGRQLGLRDGPGRRQGVGPAPHRRHPGHDRLQGPRARATAPSPRPWRSSRAARPSTTTTFDNGTIDVPMTRRRSRRGHQGQPPGRADRLGLLPGQRLHRILAGQAITEDQAPFGRLCVPRMGRFDCGGRYWARTSDLTDVNRAL